MSVTVAGEITHAYSFVEQQHRLAEPTLFIHPDPTATAEQHTAADGYTEVAEALPQISEQPEDAFWRASELGFATLWGLGGWGKTAALQMFENSSEADAIVTATERTARSLSSSNLAIQSCTETDRLHFTAPMARVTLRALRMGYEAAKVVDDRATERTMIAAQRWVVKNVRLS